MKIKRYRMVRDPWNHAHMTARDDGEFVLHEDHLALVAAVEHERDNALGIVASAYAAGYTQAESGLPSHANQHTAAQAALTAIERAAYERGVRDAAEKCDAVRNHEDTTEDESVGALCCALEIRALLTQEGR
jgi:hypothetical protein